MNQLLSVYKDSEDLINIGAYQRGSNPEIDMSLKYIQAINEFTRQKVNEKVTFPDVQERLLSEFSGG
ncbi:Type III secretion ATP synthase HrcN [compost metagenome]